MKNELYNTILYLILFNQNININHSQYKKFYDINIIKNIYKYINKKQAVSQEFIKIFERFWLNKKQFSNSTENIYIEANWLENSELELDLVFFEKIVTKYLMIDNTAGILLLYKTAVDR